MHKYTQQTETAGDHQHYCPSIHILGDLSPPGDHCQRKLGQCHKEPLKLVIRQSNMSVSIGMKMKKRSEETQTLRAGCSKAEPKIFALPQTPFSGAQDDQSLISWRWSLPLPTNPVWWGSMHTIWCYQTHPHTHKQTGPITIHCAAASAQCKYGHVNRWHRPTVCYFDESRCTIPDDHATMCTRKSLKYKAQHHQDGLICTHTINSIVKPTDT